MLSSGSLSVHEMKSSNDDAEISLVFKWTAFASDYICLPNPEYLETNNCYLQGLINISIINIVDCCAPQRQNGNE